jgi:hypothetical protein
MEPTGRFFLCGRCRAQVVICTVCDRGQRYCGRDCAEAARTQSLRAAGRRYQQTRRGRLAHAERARRYRRRQQIVTHQGSPAPLPKGLLPANPTGALNPGRLLVATLALSGQCRFCGRNCGAFVRLGFRRRRVARIYSVSETPRHALDP